MSTWLERWAVRTAGRPSAPGGHSNTPAAERPAQGRQHHTRRDFIKKAGVVGAAAWSVPVLQSALAPAHAASPGGCQNGVCGAGCPTTTCGPGNPCDVAVGQVCSGGGVCASNNICGGLGANCTAASGCASNLGCSTRGNGQKVCGGTGSTCTSNAQCVYGNCQPGTGTRVCGGSGATCTGGNDAMCTHSGNNACQANGTCK